MTLKVTQFATIALNNPDGVEIATVTGASEAVTATLNSDLLAGGWLEIVYSDQDLAAFANAAIGYQNVAFLITTNANDGLPLSDAQVAALTQQIVNLTANVVGHVIYHPGAIMANAVDSLSFTVNTPGSTAILPDRITGLPTGQQIDPPSSVTVNEAVFLHAGPIVNTVAATATNTAAGVEIATVKGNEAMTITLQRDAALTGSSIEVVYSAADLSNIETTRLMLDDGPRQFIADSINNGVPINTFEYAALVERAYSFSNNVIGHVIYHAGQIRGKVAGPDALGYTVNDATTGQTVAVTETVTLKQGGSVNSGPGKSVAIITHADDTTQQFMAATTPPPMPVAAMTINDFSSHGGVDVTAAMTAGVDPNTFSVSLSHLTDLVTHPELMVTH